MNRPHKTCIICGRKFWSDREIEDCQPCRNEVDNPWQYITSLKAKNQLK